MKNGTLMMSNEYELRFGGLNYLYGNNIVSNLKDKHIAVIGLGGVGSWCAESLIRSGVGKVTLIDMDDICVTNTNRQLHALNSTIGKNKIDVLEERFLDINPEVKINKILDFYTKDTSKDILSQGLDLVIDCIDSLKSKAHLIATCYDKKIPLVTTGGSGGKRNPSLIKIEDLNLTRKDRLLSKIRKSLRDDYEIAIQGNPLGIPCVFSVEDYFLPKGKAGERMSCHKGLGTASFITAQFGFMAAGAGINMILSDS